MGDFLLIIFSYINYKSKFLDINYSIILALKYDNAILY